MFVTTGPPFLNRWLYCHALPTACWRSECVATRPCFSYSLNELGIEAIGGGYSRMHPAVLRVLHEYPALQRLVVDRRDSGLDVGVGLELFFHTPRTENNPSYCVTCNLFV